MQSVQFRQVARLPSQLPDEEVVHAEVRVVEDARFEPGVDEAPA